MIDSKDFEEKAPGLDKKNYYDLALPDRFRVYTALNSQITSRNQSVLKAFREENGLPPQDLTPDQLTQELRNIIPSFKGRCLGRLLDPTVALHYIVDPESMADLFDTSESPFHVFSRMTGKVVLENDTLLSPDHQDLAGLVVVQAQMESPEMDWMVAKHEEGHVRYSSHYPNAKRRSTHQDRLLQRLTPPEQVNTLIALNEAIILDEAGACLRSYAYLSDPKERFLEEYLEEVRNSSRNTTRWDLSAIKDRGMVEKGFVERIDKNQTSTFLIPQAIQKTVGNLAAKLTSDGVKNPWTRALLLVEEALQIVDFQEIPTELENFCLEVLTPARLVSE